MSDKRRRFTLEQTKELRTGLGDSRVPGGRNRLGRVDMLPCVRVCGDSSGLRINASGKKGGNEHSSRKDGTREQNKWSKGAGEG